MVESPESFQLLLVLNETFRGSGDKNITILDSKMDYFPSLTYLLTIMY